MIYYPQTKEQHREIALWVAEQLGGHLDVRDPIFGLGIVRNGVVIAATAYHSWRGSGVAEISIASTSPRWATRDAFCAIFHFAFDPIPNGLGLRRLNAISHENNRQVHRLMKGMGFERHCRLPESYEDGAAVLHGMTRAQFVRGRFNWMNGYEHERCAVSA